FKQASFFAESKEGILLDFMMNFLMEGTGKFSKDDNVEFFERLGSIYNFDVSGAGISGLTQNYEEVLKRFMQVLTNPSFPEKEFVKLKEIFIDLYQRRQDSQTDRGIRLLKNLIYKNTHFDWSFDQAIELIKNIDIKKLKELHKKYLSPKNMVLSISGDFDLEKLEKEVLNIFDSWQGEKYWAELPEKSNFESGKTINNFMLKDQVLLLLGRPSSLNVYDKDLVPVKMLDFVAFSSIGSRLYQLREQTGLFYTAFGMFGANASRFNGFDYVGSILNLENVEKSEKLIFEVIDNLGKNGIYQYELNAASQSYLKGIIDLTSSNESISGVLAKLKSLELGFDYYDKVLNRVQTISLDEINKICAKYFYSKGMSKVRVGRIKG
ncbi:hypothetical protein GF385_04890, partial [Candidatus Dependentiae bacterium]|nr:hypothetical protein [Candidatus Dependentiae bacterium]